MMKTHEYLEDKLEALMKRPEKMKSKTNASPTPRDITKSRHTLGVTQSAAARRIGVTLRTWQAWEAGDRTMHPTFWRVWLAEAGQGPKITKVAVK